VTAALSWKLYFKVSKLNDKKMVCARSLNAKRRRAKEVHRHNPGSGTDVIMGLEEFSTPARKLDHNPYGKRESMKVIRGKKLRKDTLLKKHHHHPQQTLKSLNKAQCWHRDLRVLEHT